MPTIWSWLLEEQYFFKDIDNFIYLGVNINIENSLDKEINQRIMNERKYTMHK